MEEDKIRQKAQQVIEHFEGLQNSEPSDAWQQTVLQRLSATQPLETVGFSTKQYTLLILFFVVLNGAFIWSVFKKNAPPQYSESSIALKTISTELLVDKE